MLHLHTYNDSTCKCVCVTTTGQNLNPGAKEVFVNLSRKRDKKEGMNLSKKLQSEAVSIRESHMYDHFFENN